MAKLRFNFVSDLHLACSNDELRPLMQCVHFKNGYAYASDAHILIKQPLHLSNVLNMEVLDDVMIHKDSFNKIRKFSIVEATDEGFNCTSKAGSKAFFPFSEKEENEKQIDFEAVIPHGILSTPEIGVKPKYFGLLQKVLAGGDVVKISFNGAGAAMVIVSLNVEFDGQLAVVMPYAID